MRDRLSFHAGTGWTSHRSTGVSGALPRTAARASWSVAKIRVSLIAAVTRCRSMSECKEGRTRAKIILTFWRTKSSSRSRRDCAAE